MTGVEELIGVHNFVIASHLSKPELLWNYLEIEYVEGSIRIRMRRLVHISANVYWPKSVQQFWGSFASSRAIIHPTDQTKREEHNGGIDIWQIRLDKWRLRLCGMEKSASEWAGLPAWFIIQGGRRKSGRVSGEVADVECKDGPNEGVLYRSQWHWLDTESLNNLLVVEVLS